MPNKLFSFVALIVMLISSSSLDLLSHSESLIKREFININKEWQYLESNVEDLTKVDKEQEWKQIDLPHTWNQWDAVDNSPGYRRDASWYRKELSIPTYDEAQVLLYFEGVNITSTIYVNGQKAGNHIGGYVGFEVDITSFIKKGKNNRIDIRVDNGYNPDIIPSQKADFFIYGGITRDVWLKILPETNISNIHVSTPKVSNQTAETHVKVYFNEENNLGSNDKINVQIIDPKDSKIVAENTQYSTITQVWLKGDHYKWRAMRANGIDEAYITGEASDKDKFLKWAATVPKTLRNPLYHWAHLELQRYFGIHELLSSENASEIYEECNRQLQNQSHHAQGLLDQMKVEVICTTDEPTDSLKFHRTHAQSGSLMKLLPTFRPDKYLVVNSSHFATAIQNLEDKNSTLIESYDDLITALKSRIDFFHEQGGRLADHGLSHLYQAKESYNLNTI